jgi:hypothetical protein
MSFRSQVLLGVFAAAVAFPVFAQSQKAPPLRIRGTVEASSAGSLSVTTRDGVHQSLALTDATRYSAVKALPLSAIKQGSFIGSAGKPGPDGKIEALEVVVFPEEARGSGEGHYDWDLLPGSSMTNATVSAIVSGNAGRDLDLTYQGKTIKINVPKNVPVVTFVPSGAQEVKPGMAVFVVATRAEDGKLTAARVVHEKDGVKPPM